jgi:hypothetical protein
MITAMLDPLSNGLRDLRLLVHQQSVQIEGLKANLVTFEKELYDVKDMAKLLNCSTDNVRKKYIKTGKIEAFMPDGSKGYYIAREEFERVTSVVKTKGAWAL